MTWATEEAMTDELRLLQKRLDGHETGKDFLPEPEEFRIRLRIAWLSGWLEGNRR